MSINTGGLTSGSTLTNGGINGTPQFTGLFSGLNTNALIQAELAVQEQPLTNMQAEITGLGNENTTLGSIQSALRAVSLDAQLLGEPSTFFNVQTISSSNNSLVTAQTTSGSGVPVGSTTVTVSALAAAAQTSFTYTPPTSGTDTLNISDGVNPTEQVTVAANTSVTDLASQINGSNTLTVWAAVSSSGQLVLSSRNTGSQYTVSASDATTAGNLVTGTTTAGQNASYTINGTAGSSSTDTVTGAIPGVTLNLLGVTPASTPVTITAQAPGPSVSAITASVQQFISDYNTAMNDLQSAINTQPASASAPGTYNPNSGSLFGDPELENLIANMRQAMIAPGAGLPSGMAAMSDLGITTGASTGSATLASVNGNLTLNTTTLANALATNPSGVQSVITSWAQSFQSLVNASAGPGGSIDSRMAGNTSLSSTLKDQLTQLKANFATREQQMQEQWAAVEAAMSTLKAQSTYLKQLSGSTSSSSGSSSGG
ncbi:MAG TPA: flagellar filament capping protein FliD [Solirubrobacteraceae bacterium]|nr:flagellar filament capping protein FliD [Solirubrobacteraceae bacterium]